MSTVLAAARLPVDSADGALARIHPVDMVASILRRIVEDGPIEVAEVDEVWVGCAEPVGAQGANMARAAILAAGMPESINGVVIEAGECSGTVALHAAVAAIEAGQVRHVIVIGVSNSSIVPPGASALGRTYGRPWGNGPASRYEAAGGLLPVHVAADIAAGALGIGRYQQDSAVRLSIDRFDADKRLEHDSCRLLADDLGMLPAAFRPDAAVTAASFAPPADGCCGLLLGPDSSGFEGGRILATGRGAGSPLDPAGGVTNAVNSALAQAGLQRSDVGRWEIVESSAAALLCICHALDLDPVVVNPFGGALATGNCAAAEELRLIADAVGDATLGGPVLSVVSGITGAAATVFLPALRPADHRPGS